MPNKEMFVKDGFGGLTKVARIAAVSTPGAVLAMRVLTGTIRFTPVGLEIFDPLAQKWRSYKLPPQVSVDMVRSWIASARIASNLPFSARLAYFYSRYADFMNGRVTTGGPWDVKEYGPSKYQNVGNALYGYLGTEMGIDPITLKLAAGVTQSGGVLSSWDLSDLFTPTLGDDPYDAPHVNVGILSSYFGVTPTDYLK